jgi:hypothetical protein
MRKLIVLLAAVALVSGCSGSTSTPTVLPSSTSSGTAPSAEQTAWADHVCTATTTLQKDVEGLDSTVKAGGSNGGAAMTAQIATIQTSANALITAVGSVPAGSESDPGAAAVKSSADQFKASIAALQASITAFDGQSGFSKVTALASVASATVDSLSKLKAATEAIKNAAADGNSALGKAFAATPSCSALTK